MNDKDEPLLGLATTRQLLREIKARGEVRGGSFGRRMSIGASNLLMELPEDVLNYKTVNDE